MAVTYEKVNLGKVVGKDGETPYIGDNGNWWIGDRDLGVSATIGPKFYRHIISFATSDERRAAYIRTEFISTQSTEYTIETLTEYLKSQGMSSNSWSTAVFGSSMLFPAYGVLVYTSDDYSDSQQVPPLGLIYDNENINALVALGMGYNNSPFGFNCTLKIMSQTVTKV